MKKKTVALMLAILLAGLCGCENDGANGGNLTDSEPAETELRETVESVRETETEEETGPVYLCVNETQYKNGNLYYEKEFEYDDRANLLSATVEYRDGSKTEYIYDENGNMSEIRVRDEWFRLQDRQKFVYNEEGNIIELCRYTLFDHVQDGVLMSQEIYTYNEDGTPKGVEYSSRSVSWSEDAGVAYGEWSTSYQEYKYRHENGMVIECNVYEDGELWLRYEYEEERLVAFEQYSGGEAFRGSEYEYLEGSDQLAVLREYHKGEILSETEYYYDSYGNLIRTEQKRKDGDYQDEYVTEYEYSLLEEISWYD